MKDDRFATANTEVVRAATEKLRIAWQKILDEYAEEHGAGMTYLDGMMTAHNFFKLVLDHQVRDSGRVGDAAAWFYIAAGETFKRAMARRVEQMHDPRREAGSLPVDGGYGMRRLSDLEN